MRPLRSFYAFFNVTPRIRLRQQITSIGRISSYQRLVAVSIRSKPDAPMFDRIRNRNQIKLRVINFHSDMRSQYVLLRGVAHGFGSLYAPNVVQCVEECGRHS